MIKLLVDNKEIETKKGTSLLQACLDNDIYVPNLCYLESMAYPSASCRLCFFSYRFTMWIAEIAPPIKNAGYRILLSF
jgi:predicted molibdopterin-dependent oxidoreductase YjgC